MEAESGHLSRSNKFGLIGICLTEIFGGLTFHLSGWNQSKFLLLFCLTIMASLCSCSALSEKADDAGEQPTAEIISERERLSQDAVLAAIADFSHPFYQALRQEHFGNLISSPYSLSAVMAMLKIASKGVSAREIQEAMRFPKEDDVLLNGFKLLLSPQQAKSPVTEVKDEAFVRANKVYVQQGIALNKDFSSKLETYFHTSAEQLDFSNSEMSAEIINNWISDQTKNKINQLFGPNDLTPLTRVVLVSGIYLKGKWLHKFKSENTEKRPFFKDEEESLSVDMMMQNSDGGKKFLYAEIDDLDAKLISLPFKSDNLSMLILLPNKINGLKELETKLASSNILTYCSRLSSTPVEISLPKFTLESTLDLKKTLITLGIPSIFDAGVADLGGIFEGDVQELEVAQVIQKAIIEVNEEGAEAAAATGVKIRTRRAATIPEEFNANHPFIFAIVQGQEQELANGKASVVFYGSLVNPLEHSRSARSPQKEEL